MGPGISRPSDRRSPTSRLQPCLGDEHTVERILVKLRQGRERDRMRAGDLELGEAVIEQLSAKRADVDPKISAAAAGLDRDLPEADDAE